MSKIREHINLSKSIIKCKKCQSLIQVKYFDNILCTRCEKEYNDTLLRFLNT